MQLEPWEIRIGAPILVIVASFNGLLVSPPSWFDWLCFAAGLSVAARFAFGKLP